MLRFEARKRTQKNTWGDAIGPVDGSNSTEQFRLEDMSNVAHRWTKMVTMSVYFGNTILKCPCTVFLFEYTCSKPCNFVKDSFSTPATMSQGFVCDYECQHKVRPVKWFSSACLMQTNCHLNFELTENRENRNSRWNRQCWGARRNVMSWNIRTSVLCAHTHLHLLTQTPAMSSHLHKYTPTLLTNKPGGGVPESWVTLAFPFQKER